MPLYKGKGDVHEIWSFALAKTHFSLILYRGIRSIRSPAKVGLVVTELLITSLVVSWRGWETPPPPHLPAPRLNCHSLHDLERGQRGGR